MAQFDQTIFKYNSKEVRITEYAGSPWWFAKDVCDVLSLADVSMTIARLDEDEKLIQKLFVSGQTREVWLINESGLYSLILTSNKPEAQMFKRWITHEVLPAIRRTGVYKTRSTVSDAIPQVTVSIHKYVSLLEDFNAQLRHMVAPMQAESTGRKRSTPRRFEPGEREAIMQRLSSGETPEDISVDTGRNLSTIRGMRAELKKLQIA